MDPSDNLGTLLDLTQDKIVVVDAEGTYLYANAATERILGYDRETLVGMNTFEYVTRRISGRYGPSSGP